MQLETFAEDQNAADRSPDMTCLSELLTFRSEPSDVIWADDRYINAYQRRDSVPIIGIADILKRLVARGNLTPNDYYRLMLRLRAGHFYFFALESAEILHHVMQARTTGSFLTETPEMGVLRRYFAQSLLLGEILQRPGASPANASGEVAFLQSCANEVRDALVQIWLSDLIKTDEEKEIRAEWILQALYTDHLGFRSLSGLPTGGATDHELVGVSLAGFIIAGFDMRIAGKCTTPRLGDYLQWLYHRLLWSAFECDRQVLDGAAAFIRSVLLALRHAAVSDDQKAATASLILLLFDLLPTQLQTRLQANQEFVQELNIRVTPLVGVKDLRFSRDAYLRAATEAMNGRRANAMLWRSKEEVAFEPAPQGIVIKRPNGEAIGVFDQHLILLDERPDAWEGLLRSQPDWFDCSRDERGHAIESILQQKDPIARIELAQHWRDSSAAVFYSALPRKLEEQRSFTPDDLRPPNAEGLLRHYNLSATASGDDFQARLTSGSDELAEDVGVAPAFIRFAGLPVPLPTPLLKRIDDLSEPNKRELVKTLLRTPGSPLSAIHFVRLLARLAESPVSPYWRLARMAIRAIVHPAAADFRAFQALLCWTDNLFHMWPESADWSTNARIALVWAHTHKVFSTFVYLGVTPEWMKERFQRPDFGLSHDVFEHAPEYFGDLAHPKRVTHTAFALSGISYALSESDPDWLDDNMREGIMQLAFPSVEGQRAPAVDLLRNHSLATNTLSSFLGRDIGSDISRLVQNDAATFFRTEHLNELALQTLANLGSGDPPSAGWDVIHFLLSDLPTDEDVSKLTESAILATNLVALVDDLDSCQIILQSASLRATALRKSKITEHLSAQMLEVCRRVRELSMGGDRLTDRQRLFLHSLFQVIAQLSWGAEDIDLQPSAFSGLLTSVMLTFPEAAPLYRNLLNRIWPCKASYAKLMWPLLIRSRAGER
jgi:hypothetical protein